MEFENKNKILDCFEYNQHFVAMLNIINSSKLNPPKEGHKHHIIPKSWFKMNGLEVDNSEENLVLLSKENHAKVHKLAMFCVKNNTMKAKMYFASSMLGLTPKYKIKYKQSQESIEKMREKLKGRKLSQETIEKMREKLKGRKPKNFETMIHAPKHWTEEAKQRMREMNLGKKIKKEIVDKIAQKTTNQCRSEFAKKFFEKYNETHHTNPSLYKKENTFYRRHGFCSWEK